MVPAREEPAVCNMEYSEDEEDPGEPTNEIRGCTTADEQIRATVHSADSRDTGQSLGSDVLELRTVHCVFGICWQSRNILLILCLSDNLWNGCRW